MLFYAALYHTVINVFFSLVSIAPEPILSWYRDDALMDTSDKYHLLKENLGTCHFEVQKLEFVDQVNIYEIYNRIYCDKKHLMNIFLAISLGRVEVRSGK